ncbi:hypothetical protein TEA_013989 [Camellia sinensis var. sinensis]|uniref:Wall-associated receptor kinase C-terminal domain-containing protein n=1 Tax=Camellia sinensis var. sinensis TaxID=542762 RepID=A0A4S4ET33_CAMSN|nr:hypothetical protein TEA_013989 [Camellia sinensis var. sinensis]
MDQSLMATELHYKWNLKKISGKGNCSEISERWADQDARSGCGHPDFARYIRCSSGTLQFSTGTGVYTVSSIDYPTNTLIVTDPLMSNCSSMQNSGSFNLDRASPFSIVAEDIFVLLGCSTTSPVFDQNEELCDTGSGLNFCRGLYSCKGVAGIGLAPNAPISTCCVYEPQIVLGSGFMLDLPKLQCASYASIYGYGGDEGDPMKWEFGISLQYNGSHENEACKNCEDSGGLCGFAGLAESFACICRNGVNTTNNCYGRGYAWSGTCRHKIQTKMSVGVLATCNAQKQIIKEIAAALVLGPQPKYLVVVGGSEMSSPLSNIVPNDARVFLNWVLFDFSFSSSYYDLIVQST